MLSGVARISDPRFLVNGNSHRICELQLCVGFRRPFVPGADRKQPRRFPEGPEQHVVPCEHVVRRSAPRVAGVRPARRARRPEERLCIGAVHRADGSESHPYPNTASPAGFASPVPRVADPAPDGGFSFAQTESRQTGTRTASAGRATAWHRLPQEMILSIIILFHLLHLRSRIGFLPFQLPCFCF